MVNKGVVLQLQGQQGLPPDVSHLIDQLERHCLAPDGSLVSKSTFYDLQIAREEMCRERQCYLEAKAIYEEAIAMVEDFHCGLNNSPQLCETMEHLMISAEAAQRLRLPIISKDGDIHEEEIEKFSLASQSSLDSTSTGFTISSCCTSPNYASTNSTPSEVLEPGVGGVPNRFLGITPAYLWKTQLQQIPFFMDMTEYQLSLSQEIEARLKAKCDKLADIFLMDDIESSLWQQNTSDQLPERFELLLNLIIEEIEGEEAALQEDLYTVDRRFSEYYNVIEQILGVLIKMVGDLKLQDQHEYDELQKIYLCKRCETISAMLSKLEYSLLHDTYSEKTVPVLHKIRKYLLDALNEASITHDKAITRLHEYQGVDLHFYDIAKQYHDIVQKLENLQWTIQQVEMDLKGLPDCLNA